MKLGLLGRSRIRSWVWPLIFSFFYVIINDVLLPVFLGRFSSSGHYIGPLNPLLLPYRLADIFVVPVLIYFYGRISLAVYELRSNSPTSVHQLVDQGNVGRKTTKSKRAYFMSDVVRGMVGNYMDDPGGPGSCIGSN